jgi:GntR family phosphonate transport system transcriptional regulator
MVERGKGVAIWRQIGESLAADIRNKLYLPGDRLPTEPELAARYEVNRHTVRRAIGELELHGLVRAEQGRGTFVASHAIDYPIGKRTRFSANLGKLGMLGYVDLVDATVVQDTDIAKQLKVSKQSNLLRMRMIGKTENRTLSTSDHYFEQKRFPDFPALLQQYHSISKVYAHYGIDDYVRAWSRITAVLPEAEVAFLLNQAKTRPILQVEALNVDLDKKPLQYSVSRFVGDGVQLMVSDED